MFLVPRANIDFIFFFDIYPEDQRRGIPVFLYLNSLKTDCYPYKRTGQFYLMIELVTANKKLMSPVFLQDTIQQLWHNTNTGME